MQPTSKSYSLGDKLPRARYYMGGYWVFLATSQDTDGRFALIEANLRKGLEPPPHTHLNEDESFCLLEGEMTFFVNGETHTLRAGEFLHIPRGNHHSFTIHSERVKVLIHLAPAGLEEMFLELSRPADVLDYPPAPAGPPPAEWLHKAALLQQRFGIVNMDVSGIKAG